MWPSVPHLNKTLQRKKKKNHQLPLPQWTPPAAAHNTVRQLSHHSPADAVWSARPRHHSPHQTSCFMGTSTLHFISQEKRRTGGVRARPLIFTFYQKPAQRRCPTLFALWAQCSVSRVLLVFGSGRSCEAEKWHLMFCVSGCSEGQQGKPFPLYCTFRRVCEICVVTFLFSLYKDVNPVTL